MDIFKKIKYKFVKSFLDISNYLDSIIESELIEGEIEVNELKKYYQLILMVKNLIKIKNL